MDTIPVKTLAVSQMAKNLIGSEIIRLAAEVKARLARGEQVYNLTIGDFDPEVFPLPDGLLEEIITAYRKGETNYPPANGIGSLREAVQRFTERRQGLHYDADHILISGGARPIIYAIYRTLIDPGDRVIFPVPSWNNNHYVHLSGAQPLPLQTRAEDRFMPTAELLEPHLPGAAMLALCSPLNPTGTTFDPEELGRICDLVLAENSRRSPLQKPLYLLYDQIYGNLTYGQAVHCDPVSLRPQMRDYTIYVDGISKVFAATGVRVGWGFGPPQVINKMRAILSHVGAWAPKAEQVATANYLAREDVVDRDIERMKSALERRLDAFHTGFNQLKSLGHPVRSIAPQGALYLTVAFDLIGMQKADGRVLTSGADVTQFLLEEARLAIVPFSAFGTAPDSPWYRISVGTIREGEEREILQLLHNALKTLSR